MRRVLIAVPTVGARNFWRQQRIDSLCQAARESDAEWKRESKREGDREREAYKEGDRESGGEWQSVGGHTTECASCAKSLSAILVRSNFKSTQKKNQMKIVRGKMHNGKRSKEIFSNFFRLRLHLCQLARAKGKHYC